MIAGAGKEDEPEVHGLNLNILSCFSIVQWLF